MDITVKKRRGRPPKNTTPEPTPAQEQTPEPAPAVIDLDKVRLKVLELYGETQRPRYESDINGHDLARAVGYLERGLEELMDALSIKP